MRVRLSYSVELEDVPDSVAELIETEMFRIDSAKEKIGKAYQTLCEEEPHLELVLKSVDQARQVLGAIDLRLSECESILQGYKHAISSPEQASEDDVAEDQQFYGQEYNTPYEVPKESQK